MVRGVFCLGLRVMLSDDSSTGVFSNSAICSSIEWTRLSIMIYNILYLQILTIDDSAPDIITRFFAILDVQPCT